MDAYSAALAVPIAISTVLAGSLGYVLVPLFAERMATGGSRDAGTAIGQVGLYLLAISLLIAAGLAAAAGPLAAALCPGFSPPRVALTATLLRIVSLLVVANSLISFLNAASHCLRRFALPAAAGVVGTLVTLAYVALLHSRQGIHAAAWGVVIGAAATHADLAADVAGAVAISGAVAAGAAARGPPVRMRSCCRCWSERSAGDSIRCWTATLARTFPRAAFRTWRTPGG